MARILLLFLICLVISCDDTGQSFGLPPELVPVEDIPEESYLAEGEVGFDADEYAAKFGHEGTINFRYKGEVSSAEYYYVRSYGDKIILKDEVINKQFQILRGANYIKILEEDGTVVFYDKHPGILPTDSKGFTTFYYEDQKYTSRYWVVEYHKFVFVNEEANNIYLSLCDLPNFGFSIDGITYRVEFYLYVDPRKQGSTSN